MAAASSLGPMVDTLAQATDDLARATRDLARAVAHQSSDMSGYLQFAAAMVLVIITYWYTRHTARLANETRELARDTKRAADAARDSARNAERSAVAAETMVRIEQERPAEEKRMLAGALLAELYGHYRVIALVINPRLQVQQRPADEALSWSFDSVRSACFESASSRLSLLGPDLQHETVECYGLVARTFDEARRAHEMATEKKVRPFADPRGTVLSKAGEIAKTAHDNAIAYGAQALTAMDGLIPRLSEVAETANPLQLP